MKFLRGYSHLQVRWAYYLVFILILSPSVIYAADLGIFGKIYPIEEEPLDRFLQSRASSVDWRERLDEHVNKLYTNITQFTANDTILPESSHVRSWFYDPSVRVDGQYLNPLSIMPIKKPLTIIDGRVKAQVSWLKNQILIGKKTVVLIEGGDVKNLIQLYQQPIYIDYQNEFIHKFSIKHLPAMIAQEGLQLRISEVVI